MARKKRSKKPNILKGLRIEVMTLDNKKKTKKKVENQLNNHLLKKLNDGYFSKLF